MKFYPLTFIPILKDRIWGGTKLKTYLNKDIVSQTTGESWEISTVPNDISVVRSGSLIGKNINEFFGSVGGGSSAPASVADKPAPK